MDYTRKLLLIVREKCVRCSAPERLRSRILISMPHRGDHGDHAFDRGPH
jgi:hypothetical protein